MGSRVAVDDVHHLLPSTRRSAARLTVSLPSERQDTCSRSMLLPPRWRSFLPMCGQRHSEGDPGVDDTLNTILGWTLWSVSVLSLISLLIAAYTGFEAYRHNNGEAFMEKAKRWLIASIIGANADKIAGIFFRASVSRRLRSRSRGWKAPSSASSATSCGCFSGRLCSRSSSSRSKGSWLTSTTPWAISSRSSPSGSRQPGRRVRDPDRWRLLPAVLTLG